MRTKSEKPRYLSFAKRLISLRAKHNLTRGELADKCCVPTHVIVAYEKGIKIPYDETAKFMASVFSITVEKLLGVKHLKAEQLYCKYVDQIAEIYDNATAKGARAFLAPKKIHPRYENIRG